MISRMLGAARLNAETYEDVESDGGATIQALLIVIIVTIAGFVGSLLSGGDDTQRGHGADRRLGARRSWLGHMGAGNLDGWGNDTEDGADRSGLGTTGARHGIRTGPRGLLNVFLFVPYVGGFIALVTFIWSFACMVVAVRQCLDYTSTWRAFFVILISFIPVVFLYTHRPAVIIFLNNGRERQ